MKPFSQMKPLLVTLTLTFVVQGYLVALVYL